MKQIFLSYSWANRDVADEIDNDFKQLGVSLIRDVRDATNYTSLSKYMKRIRECDFALLIISNKYLKSENCMYEIIEFLQEEDYDKRILPILLEDAKKIRNLEGQAEYLKYWEDRLIKAQTILKGIDPLNSIEQTKRTGVIREILQNIGGFLDILKDKKVIDYNDLKRIQYKPIFEFIEIENPSASEEILKIIAMKDQQEQDIAFNRFREKYGENVMYYNAKGNCNYFKGEYKVALFYYEKALKLKPDEAAMYNNLANALSYIDYTKAKYNYEKAIELNPNYAEAHDNLGNLLSNDFYKDYKNARIHHEIALELNPNNAGIHLNYANILENKFNEDEEAKKHYERAIKIDPNYADAYIGLAKIFFKLNDFKKADIYYKYALEISPHDAFVHEMYADFLLKTANDSFEPQTYMSSAKAEEYDNFELARIHYEKALEIDQDDDTIHTNLANMLASIKYKDYFGARIHYEKALSINPYNAVAHCNFAVLLKSEIYKEYDKANEHFKKAIELMPEVAVFHYNYANFLAYKIKDLTNAQKCYSVARNLGLKL